MKFSFFLAFFFCLALPAFSQQSVVELNSGWRFKSARHNIQYPATVPGTVHTDLIKNGVIEDPYFRLNERGVQWIDKEDWCMKPW